jgi:hypothetical protein
LSLPMTLKYRLVRMRISPESSGMGVQTSA